MKRAGGIQSLGRAPVPEWEEVARAAWPGRLPTAAISLAGRAFLPALAGSLALLLLAAWLHLPWLGLFAWTIGALTEWLVTSADSGVVRLLDLVGLRAQLRALLRSLVAAAVVFAAVGPMPGLGYVTAVLFLQLAWIAQPVLATWISRSAPPLEYQPAAAAQPAPFVAHARAYARGVGTPGLLVALEFVALAAAVGVLPVPAALSVAGLVSAAALGWLGWSAIQARALRAAQPGWAGDVSNRLAATQPSFVVYVSLAARQSK